MSLNSLIADKLSGKKSARYNMQSERRRSEFDVIEKSLDPARKEMLSKIDKLVDEAHSKGIRLDIGRNYSDGKRPYHGEAYVDTDTAVFHKKGKELEALNDKEDAAFEALSDRSQLIALLPAKERREEMTKVLADIAKL